MKRTNPFLFKRDGSLDVAQLILVFVVLYCFAMFYLAGRSYLTVSTAAWSFLGSFVVIIFIAWAARDRAELIANAKSPGAIAEGIARATNLPPDIPSLWRDDERGEFLERDYGT